MGLFWKRKSGDQFVSLKLNEPLPVKGRGEQDPERGAGGVHDKYEKAPPVDREPESESAKNVREEQPTESVLATTGLQLEPVPTGGGPTPGPARAIDPKTLPTQPRSQTAGREARDA